MDAFPQRTLEIIENTVKLDTLLIPEELQEISYPLKILRLCCHNWRAEKLRKIYFMRLTVKMPKLEYFGMAIYPETDFDLPIFYLDLSYTRKKAIAYFNFIPLLSSESYHREHIEQLKPIYEKYRHIPQTRTRDWMNPCISPYTMYSMSEKTHLNDLKECGLDYLTCYLRKISSAQKTQDDDYIQQIEAAHQKHLNLMLANDITVKMLGKLIGKKRACRIFNEVLT